MSKVKRIEVTNLKAISKAEADFNGHTAIITGSNNKGKSSFLRGITDRLRSIKPDIVLKYGETEGRAELELTTGEKFIWSFDNKTKVGEKLVFISSDGIKSAVTKEISNKYFPPTFDIDLFLSSSPMEQRKILFKAVGIDTYEIDAENKEAREDRLYKKKREEELRIHKAKFDPTLPYKEHDVTSIQKTISEADLNNFKIEEIKKKIKEKQDKIEENNRLISELTLQNDNLSIDINKGNEWLSARSIVDINKEKKELERLSAENIKIAQNNAYRQYYIDYKKAVEDVKNAEDRVKKAEEAKINYLKESNLPEGFDFDEDGVYYKGLPFNRKQLSSSALYIAALKLAALTLGEVKTLYFDASYLDRSSLEDIESWAKDNDLQLLIERPSFEDSEITYEIKSV